MKTSDLITIGVLAVGGYLLYTNWGTLFPSAAASSSSTASPTGAVTQSAATTQQPVQPQPAQQAAQQPTTAVTSGGPNQATQGTISIPLNAVYTPPNPSYPNFGSITVRGPSGSSVLLNGAPYATISASGMLSIGVTYGDPYEVYINPPTGSGQLFSVPVPGDGSASKGTAFALGSINRIPVYLIHRGQNG
jgi:hypothetical protein